MKFFDKINPDTIFVVLGFVAGSHIGAAIAISFLPNPAEYAGSFVTAGATLSAAIIGALMIRHQLRVNYRNQVKLEKLRFLSVPENLVVLRKAKSALEYLALNGNNTNIPLNELKQAHQKAIETLHTVSAVSPKTSSELVISLSIFQRILTTMEHQSPRNKISPDSWANIQGLFKNISKTLEKILTHDLDGIDDSELLK